MTYLEMEHITNQDVMNIDDDGLARTDNLDFPIIFLYCVSAHATVIQMEESLPSRSI